MIVIETQLDLINEILDLKEKARREHLKMIEYLSNNTAGSLESFDEFLDTEHETQYMMRLNNQRIFLLNTYILHTDFSKN